MHKLVCCLLFIGCLQPLFSLPVPDSREEALKLSAPDGDARSTLDELERVYLLQMLEMLGAERDDSLRKAGLGTGTANPRGGMRQFQAFFGQDPNIFLSHLLARIRKHIRNVDLLLNASGNTVSEVKRTSISQLKNNHLRKLKIKMSDLKTA